MSLCHDTACNSFTPANHAVVATAINDQPYKDKDYITAMTGYAGQYQKNYNRLKMGNFMATIVWHN